MKTVQVFLGLVLSMLLIGAPALSQTPAEPRLAIQGYDPVAYFTEGRPMKGLPSIHQDFDGARYHFANARHKAAFVANPDRYLPQFGANCAGLVSVGKVKPGDPQHWAIVDGQLYLFSNGRGLQWLAKNPGGLAKARQQWATIQK